MMILRLIEILYSVSHCQFKFLVSRVDFGKPFSGLKAKTWFAKNQPETQRTCIDSGKKKRDFVKVSKSPQIGG